MQTRLILAVAALAVAATPVAAQTARQQPQTLEQMQAQRDRLFDRLDTDQNGVLSSAELTAATQAGGRGGRGLARWDADGDGQVARDEMRALVATQFARLDRDGDGTVTPDERPQRRGGGQGAMPGTEMPMGEPED